MTAGDDAPRLAPSAQRLGALAAGLFALPLVVGGLWAELLPGATGPALEGALRVQLALAVWVLPALWAALAAERPDEPRPDEPRPDEPRPDQPRPGLAAAFTELALLVACAAPLLALAAPLTASSPAATAGALTHALALLAGLAVWLAVGRPRRAPARVALVAVWTAAAPLLAVIAADQLARGAPSALAWLAPGLGQLAVLEGGLSGAALAGVLGPPLVAALVTARVAARVAARRPAPGPGGQRALAGAAVVLAAALAAAPALAEPRLERADPLLRDAARPGEPWPLWLEVSGAAEVSAGARTRVVVPAAPGGVTFVPAIPVGGGPVDVAARDRAGDWTRLDAALPAPRPLRTQELVIGHLGPRVQALASTLAGARRALLVPLSARDAPALGAAGLALDLVVVARGAAREARVAFELQRYAAAGGVVAFDHADDLARVAGALAAPGRVSDPWELRPLGAGLLVGPAPGELGLVVGEPRSLERLAQRLRARARRGALADALLGAGAPGPSRGLGARLALAAAGVALGLCLVLRACARGPRARAAGAMLLTGTALAALLPPLVAPAQPVWGRAALVYEAPAGASAAGRVEALALAAPRDVVARLELEAGGLPLPGPSPTAALDEATITPGERPSLVAPVGPLPRAFLRVDAAPLSRPDHRPGGAFKLTRGRAGQAVRVENATSWPLDRVLAITDRGVYALDALPPGGVLERDLDLLVPPVPFARWRLAADATSDERAWRALVTAALAGRDLQGQLVLVGRGPPEVRVRAGVAEPVVARPLVVITASEETSPR